ncbi:hypothetical protein I7I50_10883 [Histoplasma capsulatum G186AR]|uniref:Uncharacterized protein n=1 Tax=Ajellomyces capsulatus TaxID=5037 RepID=A0A8H7ZA42_AJECA|nr:hypothetical protein I7I52_02122 [Histoplasma capsulatum]QSS69556.1 hypothetical protein I7I50_10883 [Histoplasma capsulatum G186AR]
MTSRSNNHIVPCDLRSSLITPSSVSFGLILLFLLSAALGTSASYKSYTGFLSSAYPFPVNLRVAASGAFCTQIGEECDRVLCCRNLRCEYLLSHGFQCVEKIG